MRKIDELSKGQERVVNYINDNGSITSLDAFKDLGITRLSAVIFDLKHLGYLFETRTETMHNRYGEKVHFTRYFFEKEKQQ